MTASPICPVCGKQIWFEVVVETAAGPVSRFECMTCPVAEAEASNPGTDGPLLKPLHRVQGISRDR
jgi:hypothetical protein